MNSQKKQKILALYEIDQKKSKMQNKKYHLKSFELNEKKPYKEASLDVINSEYIQTVDNMTPPLSPYQASFAKLINQEMKIRTGFPFQVKKLIDQKFGKNSKSQEKFQPILEKSLTKSQNKVNKVPFKLHFPPESVLQLTLKESANKSSTNKTQNTYMAASQHQFREENLKLNQKPFFTKFKPLTYFNSTDGLSQQKWSQDVNFLNQQWRDERFDSKRIKRFIKDQNKLPPPKRNGIFYQRGFHLKPIVIE